MSGEGDLLWRLAERLLGPLADEVLGDLVEEAEQGSVGSQWLLGARALLLAVSIRALSTGQRLCSGRGSSRAHLEGTPGNRGLEAFLTELRYAARRLRRSPLFSIMTIATISVGVAGTVAVLTVTSGVLLTPLPYERPDELLAVFTSERDGAELTNPSSPADFLDWRAATEGLATLEAATYWQTRFSPASAAADSTTSHQRIENIVGLEVSPGLLSMLGVEPMLGRLFDADDRRDTVIISFDTWQHRLDARSNVIGSGISLDGQEHTVIGVMPEYFAFPPFWATSAELWAPLETMPEPERGARFLRVFARMGEGTTIAALEQRLTAVQADLARRWSDTNQGTGVTLLPMREPVIASSRKALLLLACGAVLLLLLMATNLAGLLLAKGVERASMTSTQLALGASRGRVVAGLALESLLMMFAGGLIGTALGAIALRLFKTLGEGTVPRLEEVELSPTIWLISIVVLTAIGLLVGLLPGLQLARGGERRLSGSSRSPRVNRSRRLVVAAEVAITTCLLLLAGLVSRSFDRLASQDLGFEVKQVTTLDIDLAQTTAVRQYGERLELLAQELEQFAGVSKVGAVNHLPLAGDLWRSKVFAVGSSDPDDDVRAALRVATPNYFDAMSMRLNDGRFLAPMDRSDAEPVAVINRTLAESLWPGRSSVDGILTWGSLDNDAPRVRVVGVVENVKQASLDETPPPEIYFPFAQSPFPESSTATLAIRSRVGAELGADPLLEAVSRAVPGVSVASPRTMEQVVAHELGGDRTRTFVLLLFAGLATLLASTGLFGVVAFAAHQRRQELGLRLALGSRPSGVVWLILVEGAGVALIGLSVGALLTLIATPWAEAVLFETSGLDWTVWGAVFAVVLLFTLAASLVPALRAGRTDPARVLDRL